MNGPRLGLDTATPYLALALWWPDGRRTERAARRVDRDLGRLLVAEVAAFLGAHGVAPRELAGIGVGVGPGSYTGARVGVAFALGLGRARGLPVVGSDTAAARAAALLSADGAHHGGVAAARAWVAVETRRATALASCWERSGDRLVQLETRPPAPWAALPDGAAASLDVAPDAAWHARAVDDPGAAPPLVRYG